MREILYKDLSDSMNLQMPDLMEVTTKEQLVQVCRDVNLKGRSGNNFKTGDKLEKFNCEEGILLINGVECDPGLVHDGWIYRNHLSKVNEGARILNNIFHFKKIILATKEPLKKKETIFEQVKIKDRFPMGYEKFIIKTVLGIEVPEGKYPTDIGILVLNIQTVLAIAEILENRQNGNYKYLTVADLYTAQAYAVRVKSGSNITDTIKKVFPDKELNENKVYTGEGALNCHKVHKDECILDKTCFLAIGEMPDYEKSGKCAKCRRCSKNCPMGVDVFEIVQYVEKNGRADSNACMKFHPERCIKCGACTYNCMSGKDVRGIVAWVKQENIRE